MRYLRFAALIAVCLFAASYASAQVRVGVGVGVGPVGGYYGAAPVCSYGYYGYYPYACAPYGYYGPDYLVAADSDTAAATITTTVAADTTVAGTLADMPAVPTAALVAVTQAAASTVVAA